METSCAERRMDPHLPRPPSALDKRLQPVLIEVAVVGPRRKPPEYSKVDNMLDALGQPGTLAELRQKLHADIYE